MHKRARRLPRNPKTPPATKLQLRQEILRLKIKLLRIACLLDADKAFWVNDFNGHNIAAARKVIADAVE